MPHFNDVFNSLEANRERALEMLDQVEAGIKQMQADADKEHELLEATIAALRDELSTAAACMSNVAMTLEMNGFSGAATRFEKWAGEFEVASKSNTIGQELLDRMNKAEDRDFGDGTETEAVADLVRHAWVHSAYPNCGYLQMTTEQKQLFAAVIGMDLNDQA